MNRSSRHVFPVSAGFTLVELLVVIAIIAILASILVAGASSALNAAKRARANNSASQIQTAIAAYDTEYGVYPVPPNTTGDKFYAEGDTSQQGLMFALCGNINASTGQQQQSSTQDVPNTRNIPFLTPKRSDVDANGVLLNPFNPPSDVYFNIAMDSDYSGVVGDSAPAQGKLPDFTAWHTGSTMGGNTLANGAAQGIAVWCDCDPSALPPNDPQSKNPNYWVHTY